MLGRQAQAARPLGMHQGQLHAFPFAALGRFGLAEAHDAHHGAFGQSVFAFEEDRSVVYSTANHHIPIIACTQHEGKERAASKAGNCSGHCGLGLTAASHKSAKRANEHYGF